MKFKITHISDTHCRHKRLTDDLPGGDILIHSGDISSIGHKHEIEGFISWFNKIPNYKYKIFICGNHDLPFESELLYDIKYLQTQNKPNDNSTRSKGKPEWLIDLLECGLDSNVFYLENSYVIIDDVKIYGSPYSPTFGRNWGFNLDRGEPAKQIWKNLDDDIDILITHTPIHKLNDFCADNGEYAGCEALLDRVQEIMPDLHFAGHIHEGYGYKSMEYINSNKLLHSFNGANLTLKYEYKNAPINLEYDFHSKDLKIS